MILFKDSSIKSKLKDKLLPLIVKYFPSENAYGELDNAGLILRTVGGAYVCYVKSPNKLEIIPYSEFLSDVKLRFIKIRLRDKDKVNKQIEDDKSNSVAFFHKIKT